MTRSLADTIRDGVVPAVPVLFDGAGRVDADRHRIYIEWMNAQQVAGVAIWAHTGHGRRLDRDRRLEVLELWASGSAHPLICGVGVPEGERLPSDPRARTDRVCDLVARATGEAVAGGAFGVLIHPPREIHDLPGAEDRYVAYHEAAVAAGIDGLAFFLYEDAGGVAYTVPALRAILAVDRVVGVKIATLDSVVTFQDIVDGLQDTDSLMVSGEDRFLGYSLMAGGRSALIGMAAACTDVAVRLLELWNRREMDEFVRWSRVIDQFGAATFGEPVPGYIQRMLWALEADGVIAGDPVDPLAPPLDADERDRVRAAVRALRAHG